MKHFITRLTLPVWILITAINIPGLAQQHDQDEIDRKVQTFLENQAGNWQDMNVPAADGKVLHDLIVEHGYTSALEIGTSTGHSTIWMAWALSKTGGSIITIEINESRYREALENFRKAGVDHIVDARLADAHELVPELEGPFDFVFSDADKGWYERYFLAIDPKMEVGGCYTTHNVSSRPGGWNRDYYEFLLDQSNYETSLNSDGNGLAVSFKKSRR